QLAAALGRRLGLALSDGAAIQDRTQVVHGDGRLGAAALAARLAADPDVEYAVPDYRRHAMAAPNDPLYAASPLISPAAGQWYLRAPDATFVSAIDAEAAWALNPGSAGIVVADLDTGVRPDHPDLVNKLFQPSAADIANGYTGPFVGWNFIADPATANNGIGRSPDASDPGDWTTANECGANTAAQSSSWHGTQTAGLLGAQTNNGIGMASVGHDVMLLPVRVLGRCGGTDADIIAGMLWAGGIAVAGVPANPHPARVINLSLGGDGPCTSAYTDALGQLSSRGVVVVVAAGNGEGVAVSAPGNCPGVIAVAGLRNVGTKVGFSSVGPEVALAAPGGNCINVAAGQPCLYPILTTTNSGATTPGANTYSDSSNYSVGTSFSTPLVAGTAALMLSANPALTSAQVKSLLQGSARPFPTQPPGSGVPVCRAPTTTPQDECYCTAATCGAGMLDAAAAVAAAASPGLVTASITPSAYSVAPGSTVTLDSRGSAATSPAALASYQWSISDGAGLASFTSATNAATASVLAATPGAFTVQLQVTDSNGRTAVTRQAVDVSNPGPRALVSASALSVQPGASVTFDGSGSTAASGLTIANYRWLITGGSNIAAFSGSTSGPSATVVTSGAGTVTVQLTVTDSAGAQNSLSTSVTVAAPAGGGGGGGGAASPVWVLGVAAATLALWGLRWRERRRRPALSPGRRRA
ncbi:MAG: S8 family serine peptidase, partial [Burkholderiales bacterium]|nr:S8 family serine peptidase [Burkholderiales bacterium]